MTQEDADDIIDAIENNGFYTGSQVFGTAKSDSDFDVVVPINNFDKLHTFLLSKKAFVTDSDYFSGKKYQIGMAEINLIPVHPSEIPGWFYATQAMMNAWKDIRGDKAIKYRLFESLKAAFGMAHHVSSGSVISDDDIKTFIRKAPKFFVSENLLETLTQEITL